MRKPILLLALLCLFATGAWAQTGQSSFCNSTTRAGCQNSQGPVVSGTTLYITNSVGGIGSTFSYVIAGSPATVSIVLSGCMLNGTCDTCDTYTTVANSNRTPNNWSTTTCQNVVYDYYKIVPTMATGGLFSVNTTITIAASGGSGSGSGFPSTTNVLKGSGSSAALASSIVDSGTTPTQTPEGLDTVTVGVNHEIPNAGTGGTAATKLVIRNSSGAAITALTSTVSGIEGTANGGDGTTGSVTVCYTSGCVCLFDNQTAIGDWAIPSTTTAGECHDSGSTSQIPQKQNFYITSLNSGATTTATVDILTPDVISGGTTGTPPGNVFGPASATDGDVAVFNGTTGKVIKDGGAPGLSNVVMPAGEFASSITTGVETVTKQNVQTGYVASGPQLTGLQPFVVQSHQCAYNATQQNWTCSFNSATNAGHYVGLMWFSYHQTASTSTVADNLSDSYTKMYGCGGNAALSSWYFPNAPAGVTTLTIHTPSSIADNGTITVYEIANVATSSPIDTQAGCLSSSFSGTVWNLPSVTTTVANDFIVTNFASCCGSVGTYSPGPSYTIVQQGNDPTNTFTSGMETLNSTFTGVYAPTVIFPTPSSSYTSATFALKPESSAASGAWIFQPLFFQFLTNSAFPGLQGLSPSSTAGDTQIDMHIGQAINAEGTSSAYAGNDSTSTLYTIPALPSGITGEVFECAIYAGCHTSVGAATVTPSILWTDESGTAETYAGSAAACTTLGTNSYSTFDLPIRAKSNTTIYAKTALSGSAVYDFHAHCALIGIN